MESSIRWHRKEKQFGVFCLTEMAHFGQSAIASIHHETLERSSVKEHKNNLGFE